MPRATGDTPWWAAHRHLDRRPLLLARNRIKSAIRAYFEADGFVEIETAALQVSPSNEIHLHAFATELREADGHTARAFLHTSPEFACKKLLAAGEERVFTFAPVYRNGERTRLHTPEFTMLEWYRAGGTFEGDLFDDTIAIFRTAVTETGIAEIAWDGVTCDPHAEPERLTTPEALARYADLDLDRLLNDEGGGDRNRFAADLEARGLRTAPDDTWSDLFSRVMTERVEPNLGRGRPTLLHRYPKSEAALARIDDDDPRFAYRFELYAAGVELANGYDELTDAAEQSRRFEADMDEKQRRYGERYPIDPDFLAAVEQMPSAVGCALGFDRLVMLATGARRVEDVVWTPVAPFEMFAGDETC
ncbi:MAG: EF-P lysine aminoacylase EpmA [Pseudomonadota bacterium]